MLKFIVGELMLKISKKLLLGILAIVIVLLVIIVLVLVIPTTPSKPPVIKDKYLVAALTSKGLHFFNTTTLMAVEFDVAGQVSPNITSYIMASDGEYVYVGFNDPDAKIWQMHLKNGTVSEMVLQGIVYLNKLRVSGSTLYVLAMNYTAGMASVTEVSTETFKISNSVLLPNVMGDPYDLIIDGAFRFLTTFNVSSGVGSLIKLDSSYVIQKRVEVPMASPTKMVVSGDKIYVRGSDAVAVYTKDLALVAQANSIFGFGWLDVGGGQVYVAGQQINGFPCLYELSPENLTITKVITLSEVSGFASQVIYEDESVYATMWESTNGASVVKLVNDVITVKFIVPEAANSWSTDLMIFEVPR